MKKHSRFLTTGLLLLAVILLVSGCKKENPINNFDQCVAAGNKASKAYPPQCTTADGKTFTKETPSKNQQDKSDSSGISNFQQCADAGFPLMESSPRQCKTNDGRTFTEGGSEPFKPRPVSSPNGEQACLSHCGDGTCQEVVCKGTDCPCAETIGTCPMDCQKDKTPKAGDTQGPSAPSAGTSNVHAE